MWDKNMSTSRVDEKYRIVIDKKIRAKTHIKAGDRVFIEPLDDHSFKVNVLDFSSEKLEDDPAWQAICKPVKLKKYIPPEKLEELMEDEFCQE
jgi:AbrB family looped-hinge helix DNA binding protein